MMPWLRQRGAMFGLDARIALVIFSVLTLIAGYMGLKAYSQMKTQGFAAELKAIGRGFAQLETDLQRQVTVSTLACVPLECANELAYTALYDDTVIDPAYLPRCHGPYITNNTDIVAKFGTGAVFYYTNSYGLACGAGVPCYTWLRLDAVKLSTTIIEGANALFDGDGEANPDTSGQFQWSDNGDGSFTVIYRMGRGISN